MKSAAMNILQTAVLGAAVSMTTEAEAKAYKPVEMNYVVLDGAPVKADPILTAANVKTTAGEPENVVKVDLEQVLHPSLSGLGGAFNEQGGEAFMSLPEASRKKLTEALFNPETGAGLTLCRTAVGSSDFGLGAYSYSETPNDFQMKHFSVERDTKTVIPFIRAAMAENPELKIFASPWSPPAWMKENGVMDPGAGHDRSKNVLKSDPEIYKAYALYFAKYVKAYAEHGVTIDRIVIQNETDMSPVYPGCDMRPEQMAELASGYIRPQFEKAHLDTQLWAGTFRGVTQKGARRDEALVFMKQQGSEAVDGVGLQYCRPNILKKLHETYPDLKMMHTEGSCANGQNTVKQARGRFGEMAMWLNSGCENFCYWNMVLNEEGKSGWDWSQNSLVRIDRASGEVFYNNDFAPVALLSRFIRPGDQLLKADAGEARAIAVKGKNGLIVFLENQKDAVSLQRIEAGGAPVTVELPANSVCAVVLQQ